MTKKRGKGKRTRGGDFWEDANNFLKGSHIISNVGDYALPALGGFVGSFLDPIIGPAGTAVGAALGKSGNDLIRNAGYGAPNTQLASLQRQTLGVYPAKLIGSGRLKDHGHLQRGYDDLGGRGRKKKTMKGGAYLATPSTLRVKGGGLVAVPYSMSH